MILIGGQEIGVLTGEKVSNRWRVLVPDDLAIEALEKVAPEAASWWKTNGYPRLHEWFAFGEEEVQIICGVIYQQIVEVSDEIQGDPDR
jgi:hypothetical protein